MHARILTASLVALLCSACATGNSSTTKADYSPQNMQAKWMAFMTPGPQHKVLDNKVGKWDVKVSMYNPDGSKQDSTGTSEISWLMDGRYLQENVTGSFAGMPFKGQGTTAYDNMKQRYVATWIDNVGTGIMTAEGLYDAAHKTFTYDSESPDVVAGHYVKSRSVEKLIDSNHWTVEMWGPGPDGKEMKMMELDYTRHV